MLENYVLPANDDYAPCSKKVRSWVAVNSSTDKRGFLTAMMIGTNEVFQLEDLSEDFAGAPADYVLPNTLGVIPSNVQLIVADGLNHFPGVAEEVRIQGSFAAGKTVITITAI